MLKKPERQENVSGLQGLGAACLQPQPTKGWGLQPYHFKEINSVNNLIELQNRFCSSAVSYENTAQSQPSLYPYET